MTILQATLGWLHAVHLIPQARRRSLFPFLSHANRAKFMSRTNSPNRCKSKDIQGLAGRRLATIPVLLSKFILMLALVSNLCACRETNKQQGSTTDDRQILQAQQQHLIKSEIPGRAP